MRWKQCVLLYRVKDIHFWEAITVADMTLSPRLRTASNFYCTSLVNDSLFIFCRASRHEMARRTRSPCLFYLWNQVSSSSLWMLRECVLIVHLHNSVLSFPAGLWPRLPTPALVHWCRASKQRRAAVHLHGATVGQSPRGGVFSNNPVPNPVSELNCVFVISSL